MAQVNDVPVIFAEATLIRPDERLDLPTVEAGNFKGSMKAPVIIATIPIHEVRVAPTGADEEAGSSPSSPHPRPVGRQDGVAPRRMRPVWPIGVGLLVLVMLAVVIVFSVHAAAPVASLPPPPPSAPQPTTNTNTSQQPVAESSGNGLVPEDDFNLGELDDKKVDDQMESDDWYNSTYNATDDWYYEYDDD